LNSLVIISFSRRTVLHVVSQSVSFLRLHDRKHNLNDFKMYLSVPAFWF